MLQSNLHNQPPNVRKKYRNRMGATKEKLAATVECFCFGGL